jgi:hypothetical protein
MSTHTIDCIFSKGTADATRFGLLPYNGARTSTVSEHTLNSVPLPMTLIGIDSKNPLTSLMLQYAMYVRSELDEKKKFRVFYYKGRLGYFVLVMSGKFSFQAVKASTVRIILPDAPVVLLPYVRGLWAQAVRTEGVASSFVSNSGKLYNILLDLDDDTPFFKCE